MAFRTLAYGAPLRTSGVQHGRRSLLFRPTLAVGRLPRVSSQPASSIFNREREKENLDRECRGKPQAIQIILGPRSCGKTATLIDYLDGKDHVVYINCRNIDASNPTRFVGATLQAVQSKIQEIRSVLPILSWVFKAFNVSFKLGGDQTATIDLSNTLKELFRSSTATEAGPMNDYFSALSLFIDTWQKEMPEDGAYKWPVLVIDEANRLQSWSKSHPEALQNLLALCVHVTKEAGRCHVLFVTSEFGFQTWLNNAIGPMFWLPRVIGDFEKADARKFFKMKLDEKNLSFTVDDSTWENKVYKICGGNAGALALLAKEVGNCQGDWDLALMELCSPEEVRIRKLALGGQGYTAAQFADAVIHLMDAGPHHTVAEEDMLALLGRHVVGYTADKDTAAAAGEPALQCLVEANVLITRPFSSWATDIPLEAFKDAKVVVTAFSTMALYCLECMRPRLDQTLKEWQAQQQATATASQNPSPPSLPAGAHAVQGEMKGATRSPRT